MFVVQKLKYQILLTFVIPFSCKYYSLNSPYGVRAIDLMVFIRPTPAMKFRIYSSAGLHTIYTHVQIYHGGLYAHFIPQEADGLVRKRAKCKTAVEL